jgi:DNA polymerase III subunit delta'
VATSEAELPRVLEHATEHQPAARVALAAALRSPLHAYLFMGPRGSGKAAAARAFGAELLAAGAPDRADARRRALLDPSPHPDLVWLDPPGTQHLVEEVRRRVIAAAAYRPFEGERRVFVIAHAEAMAEESQNALLKTLEEPAPFAHLILISAEPAALLETVRSRCQVVAFAALSPEVTESRLAERDPGLEPAERRAVARLARGDLGLASFLSSGPGRELRASAESSVRAAAAGDLAEAPWRGLLEAAESAGSRAAHDAEARAEAAAAELGDAQGPAARRRARLGQEESRRAARRARTEALDLALVLVGSWLRDLAAAGEDAEELVHNSDRLEEVRRLAEGADPRRARRAAELVLDTRRRLQVNVAEELALEALFYRIAFLLANA